MILTKKTVWSLLAVSVVVGGLFYLLLGGLEKNMVYFVTPSELLEKGDGAIGNPVRLGGVVVPQSIHVEGGVTSFKVSDDHGTVDVVSSKTPPQMFQAGIGVVVEGALQANHIFSAERLMVKHGNEYRPPEKGEMPQEIYRELSKKSENK